MAYKFKEEYNIEVTDGLRENYKNILEGIGEDFSREGIEKTPERAAKAMQFLTQGYKMDAEAILKQAMFKESYDEMVVVKDIELYSMCEHHMLPFFGKAHVAYIPNEKIVGLSKIARVVEAYARRLQVQERMTRQIAECLMSNLDALGVGVVLHAQHLCMMMRGIQKQNSFAVTSEMLGAFESNPKTRAEFLTLI